MPRRNLYWLFIVTFVSVVCYHRVEHNRFGRYTADVMNQISRRYYKPVNDAELFQGAVQGMVNELHDDYSQYISPKNQPDFEQAINQRIEGIGIELGIDPKTKQLTIISPLAGSPAHEAGIRAGDKILKINGVDTKGMSIKDAAAAIHGEPGKAVVLSILHEGAKEPVTVEIVRRTIDLDTVRGDVRNADGSWNFFLPGHDHIGYVRIVGFAEKTPDDFRAALDWLAANHMRGLVIDLRDNPGGLLEAAAEICDMLIDSGAIVSTCGRDKRPLKVIEASGQGPFTKFPLAVLINQDSASASEIVAACLQDHRRAVIVGERSFGKGTVQEVSELGDHRGMLKLTVASYWRPSGKNIHREHDATAKDVWGVMPDEGYKVVVNEDDFKRLDQARQRRDIFRPGAEKPAGGGKPPTGEDVVDRQLDKAVQCVESKAK